MLITSKQKKQVICFAEDAAGKAAAEALVGLPLDKDALQREVVEKDDELQAVLIPVIRQTLRQFLAERVASHEVMKASLIKAQYQSNPYFDEMLEYWINLWRELGIKNPDFAGIVPFTEHPGFRPLILPKDELITPQYLYDRCCERFSCWKWHDGSLDVVVTKNDRDPRSGAYAAWFRDRVEADEELANTSANKMEYLKIPGITLLERELMEYDYFGRIGGHLDVKNITLCPGSRYDGGGVLGVGWSNGKMRYSWCGPGCSYGFLRSRQQFIF